MTDSDHSRPGRASPRRRPATSTSAAPGRRCSTGSSCASTGGRSSCALRTPTRRATGPSGPTGSSPPSTGSACPPTRGPYFQSAQADVHAAAIEALWDSGALYACACTREEIDERTRQRAAAGDPTPGYDGYCRDLGLPRGEGRALRFRTPDEGVVEVARPGAGRRGVPAAGARGLHLREGQRQAAVRAGQRGRRPDHGDLPRDPRRGPAADDAAADHAVGRAEPGRGRGPGAAGLRPPAAAGQRAGEEALQAA